MLSGSYPGLSIGIVSVGLLIAFEAMAVGTAADDGGNGAVRGGDHLDAGFDVDEAEQFVLNVCQGAWDVPKIAAQLPRFAR